MGKTVTTYLIDGDPKGTRYAFISNKICQMFVVPRSNLSYLNEQEKEALSDTYQLGWLMKDINRLEQMQRVATAQIARYEQK